MHDELRLYNIEQAIRNLNQQSDAIMARLRNVKPFVPWREEFPDRGRITSLQAQLFENDSKKGLSARVVKVYSLGSAGGEGQPVSEAVVA